MPLLWLPLALLAGGCLTALCKPWFVREFSGAPRTGGYVGELESMNKAADIAGACYLAAAAMALVGGVLLIRRWWIIRKYYQ